MPTYPEAGAAPDVQTVFEHAARLAAPAEPPHLVNGLPVMLVPKGWDAKPVPGWTPAAPLNRVRALVQLDDLGSFSRYVSEFKLPDTRLFARIGESSEALSVTAIIDYHQARPGAPATPEFTDHRAIWTAKLSEDWKRWKGIHAKALSQEEFARFVEDNAGNVQQPSGADLLQIITTLEVDGTLTFQRALRLQDGTVKLTFNAEQRAKAGEMSVPSELTLALPVYEGEPPIALKARLRYRLSSTGELRVWIELVNPHLVVAAAIEVARARISAGCGLAPYLGTAPQPS